MGDRALDLLIVLVEHAGEVVSNKVLMSHLWPNISADETSLRVHVAALRKALGEEQPGVRYVTNVHGRGYCFFAAIDDDTVVVTTPAAVVEPTVPDTTYRLPPRLTRMIGRDETIGEIAEILDQHRFVTILGPGGVGKTTVAVSIGHAQVAAFEGAVCFFDLAPLNDPRLVPRTIASTLGLPSQSSDPTPGLIGFLRDKRMLLILDNCEHVVETAADLAERIFAQAPGVYILATSRESLRVEGEHIFRLAGLESPPEGVQTSAARALTFPAVQLFVERTSASAHRFELADADAATVADICRKLDGIALAIELAAGRVHVLGVQETASLLNKRFDLLWQGRRSAPSRQRTLRATLDWSYDLLPEVERCILRRLSVFAGFFTLEAVRSVAAGQGIDRSEVDAAIAGLVEKSLIAANIGRPTTRYRLLDTTRRYLLRKLAEQGEAEDTACNHAKYFRRQFERYDPDSRAETGRIADYSLYVDDLRVALDWVFSGKGDRSIGIALVIAAVPIWFELSLIADAYERVSQALQAMDAESIADPRTEMRLLSAYGSLWLNSPAARKEGGPNLRQIWSRAGSLAKRLGDADHQLRALYGQFIDRVAACAYREGLSLAERFSAVAAASDAPSEQLMGERMTALMLHILGDQKTAFAKFFRVLTNYMPPDRRWTSIRFQYDQKVLLLAHCARAALLRGFCDQAFALADRAVEEAESVGHKNSILMAITQSACPIAFLTGDLPKAERYIERVRDLAVGSFRDPWGPWEQALYAMLLIGRGEMTEALGTLRHAIDAAVVGFVFHHEMFVLYAAGAMARLGDCTGAIAAIDEVLARSLQSEGLWIYPELLRTKGELLLQKKADDDRSRAEACFSEALRLAVEQGALLWELRAAHSLARLNIVRGEKEDALSRLTSVYNRFTEGFETADLIAVRATLQSLRNEGFATPALLSGKGLPERVAVR
ncbi:MAG TPA: winged helix-turn-helix domain-containing protein [Bradyrhizobium sp.]|nr:winged helix-turn-helix domain-containing protein [Bradyrhizobium sp.]